MAQTPEICRKQIVQIQSEAWTAAQNTHLDILNIRSWYAYNHCMRRSLCMVTSVALLSFAGWNQSSAGEITHLPGGMKCADLLNDGRRFCVFTIEIGDVITAETFAGVGKLVAYKSDFADPVVGS